MRQHIVWALVGLWALPSTGYGLTATLGVQGPNGPPDTARIVAGSQAVVVSLTLTVQADADLGGIQYALRATKDGQPADALFAYNGFVSEDAPFAGSTRLEQGAEDAHGQKGAFVAAGAKFNPGDYLPGYGPRSGTNATAIPTAFADARAEVVFKNSGEAPNSAWTPNPARSITYEIASIGALAAGAYVISVGDSGTGFLACNQASGCVPATSGSTYTITVNPSSGGDTGGGTGSDTGGGTGSDTGTGGDAGGGTGGGTTGSDASAETTEDQPAGDQEDEGSSRRTAPSFCGFGTVHPLAVATLWGIWCVGRLRRRP